ncbi:MAG TPA: asparaginase [Pseudonocardia sp.]|jgi:L-asparaginase II|nr:asparaginase [Pseudonocardia sp.]
MGDSTVVAEVIRGRFIECRHYGLVVITAPDGSIEWSVGSVKDPMFPRSANKPLQLLGLLRSGLRLDSELLALAAGSHSGEPIHVEGVRRMLASVGLDECALQTPRVYPFDGKARNAWVRAGGKRARVTMNCSGKHAAMLMTCTLNGWPVKTYRAAEHPVQQAVFSAIEDSAGEPVAGIAVDGCGVPVHAISLVGLACAFGKFARLAAIRPQSLEGQIALACHAHPEYASGTRRPTVQLVRSVPGLLLKSGAEGVLAAGLPDGRGIAIKIEDGAARARSVVLATLLRRIGIDNDVVRAQQERVILGGGAPAGVVRAAPSLAESLA